MSRATHATALTRRLFHACSETGDLLPRLFLSEPFFISSAVLPHPPSPLLAPTRPWAQGPGPAPPPEYLHVLAVEKHALCSSLERVKSSYGEGA